MKAPWRRHLAGRIRDRGDTEIGKRSAFVSRDRKHAGQLATDAQPAARIATGIAIIDSTGVAHALAARDPRAAAMAAVRMEQRASSRWQNRQCQQQAGNLMAPWNRHQQLQDTRGDSVQRKDNATSSIDALPKNLWPHPLTCLQQTDYAHTDFSMIQRPASTAMPRFQTM
jgi:hypothetical protein